MFDPSRRDILCGQAEATNSLALRAFGGVNHLRFFSPFVVFLSLKSLNITRLNFQKTGCRGS
jgi:hypothetical protein